ncbi:MAG: nucleoside 2-deoxyribosyltransferase [Stackebrandtia sp.]
MSRKRIYLAAAIAAGRDFAGAYEMIAKVIADEDGLLLTPQVLHPEETDGHLDDAAIYARDVADLATADALVAEVSVPSLGVGFEISRAVNLGHPILALCSGTRSSRLSSMVAGCPDLSLAIYHDRGELELAVRTFMEGLR